ncbi:MULTISPECIES: GHKL domain-containing protein [Enterococcus]|nr:MULTISPECIES: GHKL domain-containing protein [Enterococcus]BAT21397.1 hypothetical protein [Enterococcus faecium]MDA3965299.1 GHKL domain-containing protein [Enterococcus thailandicus]MDK4353020.1 GHKL domain-containing protein [Enterococcus thailandicus]MDT2734598.1 GHKL domain-containing protein [Enterococcus thailandicus]MDT2752531.1 GHKL domain-containing protein [Enterococcus thailandicus]
MIIFYLIGAFLSSYFVTSLYFFLLGSSQTKFKHKAISAILIFIFLFVIGSSSFPQFQYIFVIAILVLIGFYLKKQEKKTLVIFLSIFTVLISAFLNFTEQSINTIIFRNYSKEELIVSVLNIIFLTFNIFIIRVAKPDKVASMRDYLRPNKYLIPMILINIFLLVLFSELTTSYAPIEFIQDLFLNDKGLMYLFFSLGLFTLLVLIQFGKHHTENEQNILLLRNLSDYNNEIERLNDDLAMFRHDYLNILHTLRIAIANEDLAQIKDTYEHVLAPTEKFLLNISKQNTALSKIKNIEIKSLVSYKYEYAKRRNLSVFLSINQPIFFDQTVDLVMLVRILSILLDNAIENTIPTEDKSLWISINKDINSTNFIIENSFEGTFPEMNKKKERYTTKSDKNNHGLGLLYVNQITKENDNYDLETTIENQIFSQKLTIKI